MCFERIYSRCVLGAKIFCQKIVYITVQICTSKGCQRIDILLFICPQKADCFDKLLKQTIFFTMVKFLCFTGSKNSIVSRCLGEVIQFPRILPSYPKLVTPFIDAIRF